MSLRRATFKYTDKGGRQKSGKVVFHRGNGNNVHTVIAAVYGGIMDWEQGVTDLHEEGLPKEEGVGIPVYRSPVVTDEIMGAEQRKSDERKSRDGESEKATSDGGTPAKKKKTKRKKAAEESIPRHDCVISVYEDNHPKSPAAPYTVEIDGVYVGGAYSAENGLKTGRGIIHNNKNRYMIKMRLRIDQMEEIALSIVLPVLASMRESLKLEDGQSVVKGAIAYTVLWGVVDRTSKEWMEALGKAISNVRDCRAGKILVEGVDDETFRVALDKLSRVYGKRLKNITHGAKSVEDETGFNNPANKEKCTPPRKKGGELAAGS